MASRLCKFSTALMPGTTQQSCSYREGFTWAWTFNHSQLPSGTNVWLTCRASCSGRGTYKRLDQLVCRNRKVTDALTSGMEHGIRNLRGGSGPSRFRRCRERGVKIEIGNVDSRHIDFARLLCCMGCRLSHTHAGKDRAEAVLGCRSVKKV
jgi:hypothetical protein